MAKRQHITEDEVNQIVDDYQNNGLLIKDLVKKYGRKATTIRLKFKERGIKIEYNRSRKVIESNKNAVISLRKQGKTIREIASQLGVSHGWVGKLVIKNSHKPKPRTSGQWRKEVDIQALINQYQSGMSLTDIATSCGLGVTSVWERLKSCNVDLRTRSEALRLSGHTYNKEDILMLLYDWYVAHNEIPSKVVVDQDRTLPASATIYSHFPNKSWYEILALANIPVDERTRGLDGVFYDSIEEKQLADVLYQNFISYEPHKEVCEDRKWMCDFYLPEQNLWVEYDGLGSSRRDADKFLEKLQYYQDHGYRYVVLTCNDSALDCLNLKIQHQYQLEIKEIGRATSDLFLSRVHYLKSASGRDKYRLGFYYNNILVGVVTFGAVANPHEKNICLNRCAVLDRARLPHPFNNITSWVVSRSLKWLKKTGYRGKVVSWSDPRFHNGTLYRACNFTLVDNKMKSDYIYIDNYGNEFHKSKCRVSAGCSESEYARQLGLTKVIVPPKKRWEIKI